MHLNIEGNQKLERMVSHADSSPVLKQKLGKFFLFRKGGEGNAKCSSSNAQ